MKISIAIFIIAVLSVASGYALSPSPEAQLRRVSLLLKGVPPTNAELLKLSSLTAPQFREHLGQKIDQYMEDRAFAEKMRIRLLELFQLKVTSGLSDSLNRNIEGDSNWASSVFDAFVLDLIKNNRPWDHLLTGKRYQINNDEYRQSRLDFYQNVFQIAPSYETAEVTTLEAETPQQKMALAGVLTTDRFLGRYFTTKLNENRKRAAAVFKTFLCDRMQPILLVSDDEKKALIDKALNDLENGNAGGGVTGDRHGKDPQCQSCHYKLDPMGKAFSGMTSQPSHLPIVGKLTFRRSSGELVELDFSSIGEMAEKLIQQPEYQSCQVQHFWNWFVGDDLPVHNMAELMTQFSSAEIQRRPKSFIKHLLLNEASKLQEFPVHDVRFSDVLPILNKCTTCHQNGSQQNAPLLNTIPLWQQDADRLLVLDYVIDTTDLTEKHPGFTWMPPKNAGWRLEGRDRELLKAWLRGGAKLDDGLPIYQGKSFEQKVASIKVNENQFALQATFGNSAKRFMQNFDFQFSLFQTFEANPLRPPQACLVRKEDLSTLGFIDPGFGLRSSVTPNISYYQILNRCVGAMSALPPQILALGAAPSWSQLDRAQQKTLLRQVSEIVLGPGVYSKSQISAIADRLQASIDKLGTTGHGNRTEIVLQKCLSQLFLSQEFLTF